MAHRPRLFLVAVDGRRIGGYKSGRKRVRGTPDTSSTAITRSGGTLPRAIQPEMDPCDRSPSNLASSDCPPTAFHASLRALPSGVLGSSMARINAYNVNHVNAARGNWQRHHRAMGRRAEKPASEFWKRLAEAWGDEGLPTSQNGVANELGMKGNGSTQRWYRGETLPETETLIEIAKRGNVTIDWLLTERLPKHPIDKNTQLGAIHANWGRLDDTGRSHVTDAMRGQLAIAERSEEAPAAGQRQRGSSGHA